jgi:hypothetical protein
MSGRRREGLAPNLFPFLAVLICTLGTLILLLAIVARNAGEAVAASTPAAPSEEELAEQRERAEAAAEIDRRLSEAVWHREKVVQIRDEQTAEIDERRTRQAHLEDHVRRLRDELKRLESEIKASTESVNQTAISQDAIDAMKAKIEDEKAKIEKLKTDQQTMTPRIVIVPHKGPNGTDRRPIYIECRADGVYLQPGNIAIDPKYLNNDIPGPNPLDAALKTIRLDGIETYAAARHAMGGWDDQYGYELVPDEVKLAYPEPDAVLNDEVDRTIAQTVRDQEAYARAYGGRGRGTGNGGGDGSGDGSEFAGNKSGAPGSSANAFANGEQANASGVTATGTKQSAPRRAASDLPVLSARNMDADMASALENGFSRGSRSSFAARQATSRQAAAAHDTAAQAASANAATQDANFNAESMRLAGLKSGGTTDSSADVVGSGAQKNDAALASMPGVNSNTAPDGKSSTMTDAFAPPSDVASKSKGASASTDPNAPLGGSQSSGTASNNNPAGTAPPPTDPNAPRPDAQNGSPTPSVNMKVNDQPVPKSRVKRGSKDWALPPEVAAMVGTLMVRTIRVECYDDRLVLLPEGGKGATNVYGFSDGDMDRASLDLATAIRDRVERWGAGMPGGRWQPLLEVDVRPGGEMRYLQLQRLMSGSGVNVEAKGSKK